MIVVKDWTRYPLGAARPSLASTLNSVQRLLQRNAPAWVIDEGLKLLEQSIKAFRDNER